MGTLRDEAYEKLDYLSQLTEVVVGPQNEILGQAPDRIELTLDQIDKFKSRTWGVQIGYHVNVDMILIGCLPTSALGYISDIKEYFKLEVSDDFELDLANRKMTGTIAVVKLQQQIDEKRIFQIAVENANRCLSPYEWPSKRLREKITTVLNTLESGRGTKWVQVTVGNRTSHAGAMAIRETLLKVILENEWRVRDVNVIAKMGKWINSYIQDETDKDLGLVNLLKLKMMISKDLPVYSINEVKSDAARTS